MNDFSDRPFIGRSNTEERLIRAQVANKKERGFLPVTFPASSISCVKGLDDGRSALVLHSGQEIPVAMTYEALEQKIFMPDFHTDDAILDLRPVTGTAAEPKIPKVGAVMPDETVYAGISPSTCLPMYTTASDACIYMDFNDAAAYARDLREGGYADWRVPTEPELKVLFNNRAAIKQTRVMYYWSSQDKGAEAVQCFFDESGQSQTWPKTIKLGVRCVRG